MKLELIAEGRTAEVFAWKDGQVLKLLRPGFNPQDIQYEADKVRAVVAAGVQTPAVIDVIDHEGRPGIVYERVSGVPMTDLIREQPGELVHLAQVLADLQAAIHAHQTDALPALSERMSTRLEAVDALVPQEKAHLLKLMNALADGQAVCHMDFHPFNVLVDGETYTVIDWIDAVSGPPAADVARSALLIRMAGLMSDDDAFKQIAEQFEAAYLSHYLGQSTLGHEEIDAWMPLIAAVRLTESIHEESEALIALVRQSL